MSKRKSKISNYPRVVIQWSVILVIVFLAVRSFFKDSFAADFEAYCPFGGLQAIGSYLLNKSLACTMTSTQMVMGALLLIGVFLFSKLFCAYICPIGTFSEWLGKFGARMKIRITIKGIPDKILRSLKYVLLFITLYFTFKSNELFCKEYDPFYAIVSGYDADVTALYATLAIAVAVLGAIFIRLFWCKYLCPLGAISNIFKFGGFFLVVMLVYIALLLFGLNIHYTWPLGVACLGGYVIEFLGQKSRLFPFAKITRNEDTCTNCQLCSIKCPQAIDVASMKVVKHVDCNLCSECITVCPEKDTIQINRKKRLKWLPPIAITALFVIGLVLQSFWEVPTINQKWGSQEELKNSVTFSREGMKNIKCYGSSVAFASKMKKVKGVYGVATYVGTHKVEVFYDSTIISELALEESLFSPSKSVLRTLPRESQDVTEVSLLLEHFFDAFDFSYLARLLQQETGATAVMSEYGCPIIVKIYFPGTLEIDLDELEEILESETLEYEQGGNKRVVELKFEVVGKLSTTSVSRGDYLTTLFNPYQREFNDYDGYDPAVVRVYELPLGKNAKLSKRFSYLVSHISNNDGIIKLETSLNEDYKKVLEISFVDSLTNEQEIFEMITADSLHISYTSGKKETVANMFDFKEEKTVEK
jgi:polyferredoxin